MSDEKTNGEMMDGMTIDEIINHPEFYTLAVCKGFPEKGQPDYWEITFESTRQNKPKITWLTFNNKEVHSKFYRYYKLKNK